MLEHQKMVLTAVSNNKNLFRRELIKAVGWLNSHEQTELRIWARKNFRYLHSDVLKDVFYPKYETV